MENRNYPTEPRSCRQSGILNPASTSAVREELQKERPWNLSALQTLLGRLVRRGFLQTEKQGKSRYYTPLVTEEDYLAEDSRRYFQKWTGGSQGFGCLSLCQSFGYKRGLRRIEGVYRGRNGGVSGYAYFSGIFEGRPLMFPGLFCLSTLALPRLSKRYAR